MIHIQKMELIILRLFPYVNQYSYTKESEFKGMVTVTITRVLNPATGMRDSLRSVNYYDKYGRIIQTTSENHKGGINRISFKYKYKNKDLIEESKTEHGIERDKYNPDYYRDFHL